jgi:hypothetical protein
MHVQTHQKLIIKKSMSCEIKKISILQKFNGEFSATPFKILNENKPSLFYLRSRIIEDMRQWIRSCGR